MDMHVTWTSTYVVCTLKVKGLHESKRGKENTLVRDRLPKTRAVLRYLGTQICKLNA